MISLKRHCESALRPPSPSIPQIGTVPCWRCSRTTSPSAKPRSMRRIWKRRTRKPTLWFAEILAPGASGAFADGGIQTHKTAVRCAGDEAGALKQMKISGRIFDVTSPYIVAVGGTLRPNSSTEWAMRHVLSAAQRAGARINLISGPLLHLPLYQPENAERGETARFLVRELSLADGIIIASPGYHGSISGLVKNALDYAEDLRTDARPYFSGRAVGGIATAGGGPGAVKTLRARGD